VRVFISWSGDRSKRMAQALRSWLPDVIQVVEPWVSEDDIDKGKRWSDAISSALEDVSQGVICVTRGNFERPWLNFEAGALAKSPQVSNVRPLLLDVAKSDLSGPLAEFQCTDSNDPEDFYRFIHSVNATAEKPLDDSRLRRAFDRHWPDLRQVLDELRIVTPDMMTSLPQRSTDDIMTEILDRVRTIERHMPTPTRASAHFATTSLPQIPAAFADEMMQRIVKLLPPELAPMEARVTSDGYFDLVWNGAPLNSRLVRDALDQVADDMGLPRRFARLLIV
jgi:hypothetical protein